MGRCCLFMAVTVQSGPSCSFMNDKDDFLFLNEELIAETAAPESISTLTSCSATHLELSSYRYPR